MNLGLTGTDWTVILNTFPTRGSFVQGICEQFHKLYYLVNVSSTPQQILRRGRRIADSQCKTAWFQEEVDLLRTCSGDWLPSPGRQSSSSTETTGTIWAICPLSLRFFTKSTVFCSVELEHPPKPIYLLNHYKYFTIFDSHHTPHLFSRRDRRVPDSQWKTTWFQEEVDLGRTCRESSLSTAWIGTTWAICLLSLRFLNRPR